MTVNVNIVIIAGNLTRDPMVKFLANDKAVANFTLATNNKYKKADGTLAEEVTFTDCQAWGRTAELVGQYLTKGRAALVEGRLKLEAWEKDGEKRSKLVVVATSVQFLDSKRDGESAPSTASAPAGDSADRSIERAQKLKQEQRTASAPAVDDEPPF